jgi:hypothetical protein
LKKERSEKDEEERTRRLIDDQIERAKKEAEELGLDEKVLQNKFSVYKMVEHFCIMLM